jgi:transposase
VSIAAVALDHRLYGNLLRCGVVTADCAQEEVPITPPPAPMARAMPASAALVPVAVQQPLAAASPEIMIELRRSSTVVKVSWPVAAAAGCAAWLSELLR